MAVLGFDLGPLRSAITELGQGVRQGAQQAQQPGTGVGGASGGDYLGYLAQLAPQPVADFRPQRQQQAGPGDYLGQLGQIGQSRGAFGAVSSTFAGLGQLATGGPGQFMADLASLADRFTAQKASAIGSAVGKGAAAVGSTVGGAGATYSGLPSGVAQWADQTNSTFGKYGAWVPAAMMALIQHESGGDPNVPNHLGYPAYGLFQLWDQPGLTTDQQFGAAETLLQQKLKMINDSYARLGINPDDARRSRDLFLAWSGQFDPATAGPSSSQDVGSGEDGNAYLYGPNGIMPMYDNIVKGRQQAPAGGGGTGLAGMASIWGGQGNPSINQEYGVVTPGIDQGIYTYGAAYGLPQGHTGLDIGLKRGSAIYMPTGMTGTVTIAGGTPYFRDEDYGDTGQPGKGEIMVTLANGDQIIFGHTSQINVQQGQQISAGQLLGLSGSASGDHLHLEVRRHNADGSYSLVNPHDYFGG